MRTVRSATSTFIINLDGVESGCTKRELARKTALYFRAQATVKWRADDAFTNSRAMIPICASRARARSSGHNGPVGRSLSRITTTPSRIVRRQTTFSSWTDSLAVNHYYSQSFGIPRKMERILFSEEWRVVGRSCLAARGSLPDLLTYCSTKVGKKIEENAERN